MKTNPQIVFRKEIDHTAIIFNPVDGESFGLNPTATLIWECLDSGMEQAEIISEIGKHAAKVPEHVAADVESFIVALQRKGYLSM